MDPSSKDRTGNAKLIADAEKAQGMPKAGPGGERFRRSKYGRRLAALRAKKLSSTDPEEG